MLIGFIVGGFIFFTLVIYFVVLILFPEWVGVSGRDHEKSLAEQKGDAEQNQSSNPEGKSTNDNQSET